MRKLLFLNLIIVLGWFSGCAQTKVTKIPAEIPSAAPAYTNITKGPVLLRVYQTKAALMWETNIDEPELLQYGSDNSFEYSVVSLPEKIEYESSQEQMPLVKKTVFVHKVWLENLKPGQTYNYLIANTGQQSNSFQTLAMDSNEITFVVYGDSRTGAESHKKIAAQIIRQNPDFVVHTGDLVTNGNHYEQWGAQFFEPLKGLAESVPVYAIKGNHDGKSGYFEKLLLPPGEKNDFGVNFGPVYYYFADNYSEDLPTDELLKLIASNIHAAKAEWKFISFHIPALNFSGHTSKWGYPNALPMFAKAGADFVVSGHSHTYERFKPVAPPIYSGVNFVTYITTGGGGAPLAKNPNRSNFYAGANSILHFCLFHIKGNRLTMDVIDIDGNVIDHLEISKTNGVLNEAYRQRAVPMAEVLAEQRVRKESKFQ